MGEHGRDRPTGLGAARVDDPPAAVAALAPELAVEADAERDELADPRRRLLDEDADGASAAEPAAGAQRVLGVERRRVFLAERGRDAALGLPAARGLERPLREQQHLGLPGGRERRREAGDAAADHDQAERSTLAGALPLSRFSSHSR